MAIGNIQGGPFKDWVTNQIEQREISLGKGISRYDSETGNIIGKQNQDLLYQQSKTPWLRLASSVNIKQTGYTNKQGQRVDTFGALNRLLSLPNMNKSELEGTQAAKNFILQGGSLSLEIKPPILNAESPKFNKGLNTNDTPSVNQSAGGNLSGAYGWGGTTERGFVPMPGITSANVKYENDGALTKTTINIKCFSRNQFALIDTLYMRPGYTLLLEFGWSAYLGTNNNGQLLTDSTVNLQNSDNFFSPALSLLLNPQRKTTNNQYKIIQAIKDERERTSGNYEAVFGKITNFKWSMDPDGSYNCVVELRGLGEMIESLRLNVNTKTDESKINDDATKLTEDALADKDEDNPVPLVAAGQSGGTLIENLFAIYQNEKQKTGEKQTSYGDFELDKNGKDIVSSYTMNDFPIVSNNGGFVRKSVTFDRGIISLVQTTTDLKNFTPQVYIKFGILIALIQKNIVPTNGKGAPNYVFDMNFENLKSDKNFIRRFPGQFPIAPHKFIIPYTNHELNNLEIKFRTELTPLVKFEKTDQKREFNDIAGIGTSGWGYNKYLGRLANVYVNINHVAQIILDMKGKINDIQKNEKDLFAFLKQLLTELNISLGGINNVKIKIPNEGERIRFVEDIPQTFGGDPPVTYKRKMCKFNTFGFNHSNPENRAGSIVRNLSIDASIPSNFSTMISIGAQSQGNQPSGNATSFSNYNAGIIDRVIPRKVLTDKDQSVPEAQIQLVKMDDTIKELNSKGWWSDSGIGWVFNATGGLWADVFRDRNWYGDDIETFMNLGTTYHQQLNGLYSQPAASGGLGVMEAPFFLPFNLSLDLDGISGIVMMQRFEIDQKILPPSYDKDSVEIIVKTVDHEVTKDSWITKLGTQSVPKIKLRKVSTTPLAKGGTGNATNKDKVKNYTYDSFNNRTDDPVNALRRTELTLVGEVNRGSSLGVLTVFETDETTVRRRFACIVGPGNILGAYGVGSKNLTGERFLCVSDESQYGKATHLIGNSSNGYDYNTIQIPGVRSQGSRQNLFITGGSGWSSRGYGDGNILIGYQFQSQTDGSQIDKSQTGLGTYYRASGPNINQQGAKAQIEMMDLLQDQYWYMDVVDLRNQNTSGVKGGYLRKLFLTQLSNTFPNDIQTLYPPKGTTNLEQEEKKFKEAFKSLSDAAYDSGICCFIAGTKITLADGNYKNIEDIIVGDEVVGWKDGKRSNSAVIELKPTLLGNRSLYNINDFKITFTDEHPFLTKDGWKSIVPDEGTDYGILKVGDIINKDNKWTQIKEISKVQEDSQYDTPVYNFTVKDIHSYIADDIIVHNK
tara:strand:+ start:1707 stop:5612 length:3906 start_codon:yes stop_codon:yes gene_type:complete